MSETTCHVARSRSFRRQLDLLAGFVGLAFVGLFPPPLGAANFLVYNNLDQVDVNPGNGTCDIDPSEGISCTLRAAVMEANALAGADIIRINPGVYNLTRPESADDDDDGGDLDIYESVTVQSAGVRPILDGQGTYRIFQVASGDSLTLREVELRNGASSVGGCVNSGGDLTVEKANIHHCVSTNQGGGIAIVFGHLTVLDSWIHDNQGGPAAGETNGRGGGIYAFSTAPNLKLVRLERVTLEGNLAATGGGLGIVGEAVLVNVTIRGNTAVNYAGGIFAIGDGRVSNTTVVGNSSAYGAGGIFSFNADTWRIENSVIAQNNNTDPPGPLDCDGAFESGGYNLIGIGTECTGFSATGDVVGAGPASIDPLLEPVSMSGGWAPTRKPAPGSPLLQAGDPAGCLVDRDGSGPGAATVLSNDQRGATRPASGRCERGAVELGPLFLDDFENRTTSRWAVTAP